MKTDATKNSQEDQRNKAEKAFGKLMVFDLNQAVKEKKSLFIDHFLTVLELLDTGKNLENFAKVFDATRNTIDKLPNKEAVCFAGCSHCCNFIINISSFEAAHLAQSIKETKSLEEIELILDQAAKKHETTKKMDIFERNQYREFCPLLVDHKCSVYESRPFACQGHSSTNLDVCISKSNLEEPKEKSLSTYMKALSPLVIDAYSEAMSSTFSEEQTDEFLEDGYMTIEAALVKFLPIDEPLNHWLGELKQSSFDSK